MQLTAQQIEILRENAKDDAAFKLLVNYLTENPDNNENIRESKICKLLQAEINTLDDCLAVLDNTGRIIAVNDKWRTHAAANGYTGSDYGIGLNYVDVCHAITPKSDADTRKIADGLQLVLSGALDSYSCEINSDSDHGEWQHSRV